VVVPKRARNRLGWLPGTELEVVGSSDSITLRPRRLSGTISIEEAVARFRTLYRHEGPPVPIEALSWSADMADADA